MALLSPYEVSIADRYSTKETDKVSLGTTIVAVAFNGGVVVGADSRTTTGNYIANRVTDKITPLTDHIYLLRSGSAADTQAIASYVQFYLAQHQADLDGPALVKTAANLCMQMSYSNKEMLSAGMIIAGWDEQGHGAVYALPLGGTLLQVPFSAGGSGSVYINGFIDKNFRPDFDKKEARDFVLKAVSLAIARDASSGGCVRLVTIDKEGAHREFIPGHQVPLGFDELQ